MTGLDATTLAGLITAISLLITAIWQGVRQRAETVKLRAETAKIRAELRPNSGHSMRDQVTRMESQISDIRLSLGGIRDDARADREALSVLHRDAAQAHNAIHDRLRSLEDRNRHV